MTTEKRRSIGLFWIALAGLFLADPSVGFYDWMPDAVGYLLLCVGLQRLADLNDSVEQAWRGFRAMAWVGVAQIVAAWVIHHYLPSLGTAANPYERPVSILLCVFLTGLARCCFLIPAFRHLFRGIQALAELHGGSVMLAERRGKSLSQRMSARTTRWILASSILSILPELAVLTTFEYNAAGKSEYPEWFAGGQTSVNFDWYTYVELFRLFVSMILIVICLLWVIGFLRWILCLRSDASLRQGIEALYQARVAPRTGMLTVRRLRRSAILINAGAIFAASFRNSNVQVSDTVHSQGVLMGSYELLPGVVCALLVLLGVLCLEIPKQKKLPCAASCLLLGGVSVAQALINNAYLSRFYPGDSLYREEAYWSFLGLRAVQVAEALATLLVIGCLLLALWQVVCLHTGPLRGTESDAEFSARAGSSLRRELKKQMWIVFALFFVAAVAQSLYTWMQLEHPWMWIIALVLWIFAIGKLIFTVKDILEEAQERYREDFGA